VHVGEVEHGADPAGAAGDLDHIVEAPDLAHAAHHLDAERHRAVLPFEALSQLRELPDDRVESGGSLAAEQEAGVEDHELGAARLRDSGGVVEHPDRHALLLVALDVAHEAGDRRVHREDDLPFACKLAEPLGPRVVHPEAAFEVDLAGVKAALLQQRDGGLRALARGNAGGAEMDTSHRSAS
jgi:hypothetical protein